MSRRELEVARETGPLPPPGESMNLRGEIVAPKTETIEVWMLRRVWGEHDEALPAGTKQTVSAGFGRSLIAGNRAERYAGQGNRGNGDGDAVRFSSTAAAEAAEEAGLVEADFEGRNGSAKDGSFTKADVEAIVAEFEEADGDGED